jgi:hypothetical protein
VVSVGHVSGGDFGAPNIIPSEVVVRGTSRSYKPAIRDLLQNRLTDLAHAIAGAFGCTAVVDYDRRYPPLVNHSEQTDVSVAAARALVGEGHVMADAPQLTGSEDFSFMLEARPGGFIMIGNGVAPDGSFHNVHTPGYDFNDEIITRWSYSRLPFTRAKPRAASPRTPRGQPSRPPLSRRVSCAIRSGRAPGARFESAAPAAVPRNTGIQRWRRCRSSIFPTSSAACKARTRP